MRLSCTRLIVLTLAAIVGLAPFRLAVAQDGPARLDPTGDALPRGAVARLGSSDDDGKSAFSIRAIQYSPDGRHLGWMSSAGSVHIWDVRVRREVIHLAGSRESFLKGFTFSPDGRFFAVGRRVDGKTPSVIVYEMGTGREHAQLPFPGAGYVGAIAFAPDSKLLAVATHDQWVRFWDLEAGRSLKPIEWNPTTDKVAFSPDGRRVAFGNSFPFVGVWDVQTHQFAYKVGERDTGGICCLGFSPDGRYLATGAFWGNAFLREANTGTLVHALTVPTSNWRVGGGVGADGVRLDMYMGMNGPVHCLAFSPDSRVLAVGHSDGTLRLWETATVRERFSGKLPMTLSYWYASISFAPDGATLATGGPGDSVLIWDVMTLATDALGLGAPAARADADTLWRDLADRDAAVAYRAMIRLAADRPSGRALLREKFAQERFDSDPTAIRRWIDQLRSDRFAEREQAAAELRRVGHMAEVELRAARAVASSAEVRSRLDRIIAELTQPANTPELLRLVRCLEVLEQDGTAEAEQLIRELVRLFPQSRLASEVDQALQRMKKRRQ